MRWLRHRRGTGKGPTIAAAHVAPELAPLGTYVLKIAEPTRASNARQGECGGFATAEGPGKVPRLPFATNHREVHSSAARTHELGTDTREERAAG